MKLSVALISFDFFTWFWHVTALLVFFDYKLSLQGKVHIAEELCMVTK